MAQDQQMVLELLAAISVSDGGKSEKWATAPMPGASGQCPAYLSDAIWDFQWHWKQKGLFHNIDGVVDPGGNTYKQLVNLARRSGGGREIPNDQPYHGDSLLNSFLGMLRPNKSNLTVVDAQIGIAHSKTIGMMTFEVAAGRITFSDFTRPGLPKALSIQGIGGSWGKVISSSAISPAVDRHVHVGAGKNPQIGLHELAGTCLLVNAWSGKVGRGTTTIIFNIGPQISIKNLNQDYALEPATRVLRDATHTCSGFVTVSSSFSGSGGSFSIIEGRARMA